MPFLKGENPHRPAPEAVLKVEPIRDKRAIGRITGMATIRYRWRIRKRKKESPETLILTVRPFLNEVGTLG